MKTQPYTKQENWINADEKKNTHNAREEFQPKKKRNKNKIVEHERDSFHSTQNQMKQKFLGKRKRKDGETKKKINDLEIYFVKACIPCLPFDSVVVGDCKQKMLKMYWMNCYGKI